ncbi:5'-nucleotidase [Pseudomonas helleri]|uniref:5'-nucleotidase n=1 Tax=Pseudomonas helleri TaxID=1608996 RepID=UPI003FD01A42
MDLNEVVIVSTARTALAKSFRGSFNDTEAPVLGGHVVRAVVERAGIDPADVEDVIMGAAVQQGTQAYNIGRLCAYTGGLPESVLKTIEHYGLGMTRAIFMQGKSPYEYIPALNIALFLSGEKKDVEGAIKAGYPAGQVLDSKFEDDETDRTLRIAFDFDGVLAGDESESIMQTSGLTVFHAHEVKNVMQPHNPGPLKEFMVRISKIQTVEEKHKKLNPEYENRIRVSIVTARNAPSHERAMNTLKSWGVMANDAFFLGGIEKGKILGVLKPHIFFDDQSGHLKSTSAVAPSVHIPFGITNNVVAQVEVAPEVGQGEEAV